MVLDGDRIDIRGEAATAEAADAIKKALEETGRYASVDVRSSAGQAGRMEFELKTTMAKKR